jgi:hypothetical protein
VFSLGFGGGLAFKNVTTLPDIGVAAIVDNMASKGTENTSPAS